MAVKKIALGSDHAGAQLKEEIIEHLNGKGYGIKDFGTSAGGLSRSGSGCGRKRSLRRVRQRDTLLRNRHRDIYCCEQSARCTMRNA